MNIKYASNERRKLSFRTNGDARTQHQPNRTIYIKQFAAQNAKTLKAIVCQLIVFSCEGCAGNGFCDGAPAAIPMTKSISDQIQ